MSRDIDCHSGVLALYTDGQRLPRDCTLQFHSSVSQQHLQDWCAGQHAVSICPPGGFTGKQLQVIWDIENARPDAGNPNQRVHVENIPDMFRAALQPTGAEWRVTGSLSKSYPAGHGPNYDEMITLSAATGITVIGAVGKHNPVVHRDMREADHMLKSQMEDWLDSSLRRAGDILLLISGDGGFWTSVDKLKTRKNLQVL